MKGPPGAARSMSTSRSDPCQPTKPNSLFTCGAKSSCRRASMPALLAALQPSCRRPLPCSCRPSPAPSCCARRPPRTAAFSPRCSAVRRTPNWRSCRRTTQRRRRWCGCSSHRRPRATAASSRTPASTSSNAPARRSAGWWSTRAAKPAASSISPCCRTAVPAAWDRDPARGAGAVRRCAAARTVQGAGRQRAVLAHVPPRRLHRGRGGAALPATGVAAAAQLR